MTNDELNKKVKKLMERFDEVNQFYIDRVAEQIAEIGTLNASTMHVVEIMAVMNENIAEINSRIAKAAKMTVPEVHRVYETALNDVYRDDRFERALKETPLPATSKRSLERFAQAASRQTADQFMNFSNTTAASETYRKTVDKAVLAVSSGIGDYHGAIRSAVREMASNGLQVVYESGYRRRLDTAVRQNIIDGVKQIQQHASDAISEELNYDAKEISVHANSAPDHEPLQGHIFMNEEFEKLQTNHSARDIDGRFFPAMRRPIAEWNCMHFAMGFSTKYTKRKYTLQQLDDMARKNAEGCEIDGKHYTMYQVTQLMRSIETEVRRQKDAQYAAEISGDDVLKKECRARIRELSKEYSRISDISGLSERRDRMRVVKPR